MENKISVWVEACIIMGAVPTGDYWLVVQAKEQAGTNNALREAYIAGGFGLLGVVRGKIVDLVGRDSIEAGHLFREVEGMRQLVVTNPQRGFSTIWNYFHRFSDRVEVVSECFSLFRELETLSTKAKNLPFSDIPEDIEVLRIRVVGFLSDRRKINTDEVQPVADEVAELSSRVYTVASAANTNGTKPNNDGKGRRSKRERLERRGDWRKRMFPNEEE